MTIKTREGREIELKQEKVYSLRMQLPGRVILPGDVGYFVIHPETPATKLNGDPRAAVGGHLFANTADLLKNLVVGL